MFYFYRFLTALNELIRPKTVSCLQRL